MSQKWFKFYGAEYLSDPKMLGLSPAERSCWITLLCYASVSENEGQIKYLSESHLLSQSGLDPAREEWDETQGILKKFELLKMIQIDNEVITLVNYKKKQETSLTGYERLKKYRQKKYNDNAMITIEEKRIEENRRDKNRKDKNRKDKNRVDAATLKILFFKNPIFEKLKKTYPDRDYDLQFDLMADWWNTNKNGLPKNISAFSNWLKFSKPDEAIVAERKRLEALEKQAEQNKKMDEYTKAGIVPKERVRELLQGKKLIGKI